MLEAIALGLIQGVAAMLPVSAFVHRVVFAAFAGLEPPSPAVEAGLELGSLLAVALYFGVDWLQIVGNAFGLRIGRDPELQRNRGLLAMLAAATLPVALTGFWLGQPEMTALRDPYLAGVLMITIGVAMGWAERTARWRKALDHLSVADAMLIGVVQSLAVLPGASRMALVITAALLLNFDRAVAARIGYLLALPVMAGRGWFAVRHLMNSGGVGDAVLPFAAAGLVCALAGVATIAFFLEYLSQATLAPFVRYRVVFGIIVIALAVLLR